MEISALTSRAVSINKLQSFQVCKSYHVDDFEAFSWGSTTTFSWNPLLQSDFSSGTPQEIQLKLVFANVLGLSAAPQTGRFRFDKVQLRTTTPRTLQWPPGFHLASLKHPKICRCIMCLRLAPLVDECLGLSCQNPSY